MEPDRHPAMDRPDPFRDPELLDRNRDNPTLWHAIAVDPTLHVPDESRALQIRSYQRWTRRALRPLIKAVCVPLTHMTFLVKRWLPHRLGSEHALNWFGPRFMRRCVAPEALELVLRHFTVESNLINFIAVNCGADDVEQVSLYPRSPDDLGDHNGLNAIIRHDANVFNLVIDLGESESLELGTPRSADQLDFSMLGFPAYEVHPDHKRFINLDLESALQVIVLSLALFMDYPTLERAVNSFQTDESMCAALADITGDPAFRSWAPIKMNNWVGMTNDPARDLHWHFLVDEYAHTRLTRLRDAATSDDASPLATAR